MATNRKYRCNSRDWQSVRAFVLARDGYFCWVCGHRANTVDHILPRSKGGSDLPTNLAACCAHCNYSRKNTGGDQPFNTVRW